MNTDYKKQAEDFLVSCGILFDAKKAIPQKSPNWANGAKHRTHYSIRLAKLKEKESPTVKYWGSFDDNLMHCSNVIEFSFWNSIHAKEQAEHSNKGDKPNAYDVLAGIYNPVESFADFCSNFGYNEDSRTAERIYNEDSRTAERIYNEDLELNKKIETIFTAEELEKLTEIQ